MEQPENNTPEENVVLSIESHENDIIPDTTDAISNVPEMPTPIISEQVTTVVQEIPVQISRKQVSSVVNNSVKEILAQVSREYVSTVSQERPSITNIVPVSTVANIPLPDTPRTTNSVSESIKSAVESLPPTENVQLTAKPKKQVHLNHNQVDWFAQTEYIVFSNELKAIQRNNIVILKECKENKRLLDLKYDDLNTLVNNIQTSVIFFSTISGFIQATRIQFNISDKITSIFSITVSTYISLLLSISKYYKLDEIKEKIQTLREKYSLLHNKLDHRMDIVGPWGAQKLWVHQDPAEKYKEWSIVRDQLDDEYADIIVTKQTMSTEFEVIMDTKSRNQYFIKNRELNYKNRELVFSWDKKESELSKRLTSENVSQVPPIIKLQHEELDNWAEHV